MYLQLLELCHFVDYFSRWLMLILRLNVLLVYIFKVASGCDFFFFRICFKALPGLRCRQKCVLLPFPHPPCQWMVPYQGVLWSPVHAPLRVPPGWEQPALDLNMGKLIHAPHVSIRSHFWIGPWAGCFSVPPTKVTAAVVPRWRLHLSLVLEQVRSPWKVRLMMGF